MKIVFHTSVVEANDDGDGGGGNGGVDGPGPGSDVDALYRCGVN